MKIHPFALVASVSVSALIAAAGCSDKSHDNAAPASADRTPSAVAPAEPGAVAPVVPATPDPFAEISDALRSAGREQSANLAVLQERMQQSITERLGAIKASGRVVPRETESKLDAALDDFSEKVKALSTASAETWESARSNAVASLDTAHSIFNDIAGH
jgi:hypothetical protein